MKLGVFGGTFDPVHYGHLAIALAAIESLALDRVVFVPAKRSPLKNDVPVASAADRVAMLERAIADEPRFECSRLEIERPAPSYSVDTLAALSGKGTLFLILGADAARDIERWKDVARIRALATVVVARRPGSEMPAERGLVPLDAALMDVSSRDLRARAARGRSLRYLVPDSVWRYITDRDLYRVTASTAS
ncbi:MAG: nicotinate-nucleotide adenylyltransferase [Chloroflexota bacterium]|nr:nicotinate-nucleotide adenylyltransferase [Chloroflexota bacterium]